jgi:hypothetical protein
MGTFLLRVLLLVWAAQALVDPRLPLFNRRWVPSSDRHQRLDASRLVVKDRGLLRNKKIKRSGPAAHKSQRRLGRNGPKMGRADDIPICQPPVLSFFNIRIMQNQKPRPAVDRETTFCRANQSTCCSVKDFKRVQKFFVRGTKKYQRMMEFIEETLTLFKGNAFWSGFQKLVTSGSCVKQQRRNNRIENKYLGGNTDEKPAPIEAFLGSPSSLREQQRIIDLLLEDFKPFSKTTFYFYSNIICTVCDPFQNTKFHLESNSLSLSPDSCFQIIQNRLYELRLAKLMLTFLFPVSNYISCLEQEKSSSFVATMVRIQSTEQELLKTEQSLNECLYDLNTNKYDCPKFCNRRLAVFSFTYFTIIDLKSALKTLFQFVNARSIDEYYEHIKEELFENILDEDREVEFFEKANLHHTENIMETMVVQLQYSGANPFLSYMNKKFWIK